MDFDEFLVMMVSCMKDDSKESLRKSFQTSSACLTVSREPGPPTLALAELGRGQLVTLASISRFLHNEGIGMPHLLVALPASPRSQAGLFCPLPLP